MFQVQGLLCRGNRGCLVNKGDGGQACGVFGYVDTSTRAEESNTLFVGHGNLVCVYVCVSVRSHLGCRRPQELGQYS